MAKKSKNLRAALEKIDSTKLYSVEEAVALAKETNFAKFDASVEVAYNLNIDVRKADQQIRGAMVLPNGTGKTSRVLVFARGAKAEEAKAAGADFVGEDDLVAKINGGWLDFDVVIATPDMMAVVGRLGRVLGPRNLMPNPKTGTVTMDVAKAVEESKGGKITYRADKAGIVQALIGKVSFDADKLVENFKAFHDVMAKAKPATAKGTYMTSVTITTTQGVGIKVVKNRLVRVAMSQIDALKDTDTSALKGQVLYAYSSEDEVMPAKILNDFAKDNPSLELVGAFSGEGANLDTAETTDLAKLPSKNQLIAEVVATLLSPVNDVTNALSGNLHALLDGVEAKANS